MSWNNSYSTLLLYRPGNYHWINDGFNRHANQLTWILMFLVVLVCTILAVPYFICFPCNIVLICCQKYEASYQTKLFGSFHAFSCCLFLFLCSVYKCSACRSVETIETLNDFSVLRVFLLVKKIWWLSASLPFVLTLILSLLSTPVYHTASYIHIIISALSTHIFLFLYVRPAFLVVCSWSS